MTYEFDDKGTQLAARRAMRQVVLETGGDRCLSCGGCVAGCPVADWSDERLDPRRLVRLIQSGLGEVVVQQDWIWQCTNCGRCTWSCPAGVDLASLIDRARSLVPRDRSPGNIQKTADLHRTTSNNMSLKEDEWLENVEWMRDELEDELPGLVVPVDRQGAEFYAVVNSKLPMYYPVDMQDIFKIFHLAGVDWTLSSRWWEATNYAIFTGDVETWEQTLRAQVARVRELGCKVLAYTECGHGYYATHTGIDRFGIEAGFEVIHVVNLYARWIREGRFKLDPSRNPGHYTVHDPCNAVRKAATGGIDDIADDVRFVLSQVCEEPVVEMTPNRDANFCCSGGGGALLAGFKRARVHFGRVKVEQIDRTGAQFVCTPCVNCFDAITGLADAYDRPWETVHLWKLLANAIVVP